MTKVIDYSSVDIPDDESPEEYHYTARRADLYRRVLEAGSPSGISQTDLADYYDVSQAQISQDMDAIGEHVAESLGSRATLSTRAAFERIRRELFEAGEWKQAWDVIMDWNEWLAKVGAQEREPQRSEIEMDMQSRQAEVSYTIVRDGDDDPQPTVDDSEQIDYEQLGFSAWPGKSESDAEATEIDIDE